MANFEIDDAGDEQDKKKKGKIGKATDRGSTFQIKLGLAIIVILSLVDLGSDCNSCLQFSNDAQDYRDWLDDMQTAAQTNSTSPWNSNSNASIALTAAYNQINNTREYCDIPGLFDVIADRKKDKSAKFQTLTYSQYFFIVASTIVFIIVVVLHCFMIYRSNQTKREENKKDYKWASSLMTMLLQVFDDSPMLCISMYMVIYLHDREGIKCMNKIYDWGMLENPSPDLSHFEAPLDYDASYDSMFTNQFYVAFSMGMSILAILYNYIGSICAMRYKDDVEPMDFTTPQIGLFTVLTPILACFYFGFLTWLDREGEVEFILYMFIGSLLCCCCCCCFTIVAEGGCDFGEC